MFAFQPAVETQTHQIGYGLGTMQLESAGDIVIGYLGTTAGYAGFTLYVPAMDRYVSGFMNAYVDPSPFVTPIVERLAQP